MLVERLRTELKQLEDAVDAVEGGLDGGLPLLLLVLLILPGEDRPLSTFNEG